VEKEQETISNPTPIPPTHKFTIKQHPTPVSIPQVKIEPTPHQRQTKPLNQLPNQGQDLTITPTLKPHRNKIPTSGRDLFRHPLVHDEKHGVLFACWVHH